jgi:hypothetical protein
MAGYSSTEKICVERECSWWSSKRAENRTDGSGHDPSSSWYFIANIIIPSLMVPAQTLRRARTERITQPCCRAKIHAPAWHIHVQETRRTGYEAGKLRLVGVHASATNTKAETTNRNR